MNNIELELLNTESTEQNTEVKVEWQGGKNAGKALEYMGVGMLGIFLVTGIIILTISLLNKIKFKSKD